MRPRFRSDTLDLIGQIYGRLTVIQRTGARLRRSPEWQCHCECGNTVKANSRDLRCGNVKSCGCLKRDSTLKRMTIHGATRRNRPTPEYRAWYHMKERCSKPN